MRDIRRFAHYKSLRRSCCVTLSYEEFHPTSAVLHCFTVNRKLLARKVTTGFQQQRHDGSGENRV